MGIAEQTRHLQEQLPAGVSLVAVSKFHPVAKLMEAYGAGQRDFGESRVQELAQKAPQMPGDVRWHFIGHLQSNKVRQLVPHAALIHSIDSLDLLETVNREAARIGRTVDVLLQVHVARELTKYGFTPAEMESLASDPRLTGLSNVRVRGLMAMATLTDDEAQVRHEFAEAHHAMYTLKQGPFFGEPHFNIMSMGMSDDYRLAIAEGSTMVRIGTAIFGPREY